MTVSTSLDFYAAHKCALFPIPAGQKNPTGIVPSFALDCSRDPAQWDRWRAAHPGCNFGVVAGPSSLIVVDVDASGDRDEAWALWADLCTTWGLPAPLMPHCQSARGGWHIYFAVPEGVDATSLRQPDAVKGRINVRAGKGFVVCAGSTFEGSPYLLMSDAPPHPAPEALLKHCSRGVPKTGANVPNPGMRDASDVAAMLTWLAERESFAAYEDWIGAGMALKLEFGDAGQELWALTHDATVTPELIEAKWDSFAAEPTADSQTLGTWIDRARKAGWRGGVRRTMAAMFDGAVAKLAASAGAELPGMPMLAGQAALTDIAAPILTEFLARTEKQGPFDPLPPDCPQLPDSVAGHGLYHPLIQCIDRVLALALLKGWKSGRVIDALAILQLVHQDTFDAVIRKLRAIGVSVPDAKIRIAAQAYGERVERTFVANDAWQLDSKGEVQNDNSDNVAVYLNLISARVRWNGWLERPEIQGGIGVTNARPTEWTEWTFIDDIVAAKLRTRANRTKTRFRPGKDFFWESLLALAHDNPHDPVLERLSALAQDWDGTPRLATWLTQACGAPDDAYHRAVARNIVGGMVRRARHPGCKHDTMPVFYGFQGSGKSTMALLLALSADWFSDSILLGDASKELVLSLAGKLVVEISEMGMRGATNPNHVKRMLSTTIDEGRPAYARAVVSRPRRNIFIGTTNDDEPLLDHTGNRRFLPVKVDRDIDLDWMRDNVGQLIGEAARIEAQGDDFAIPRAVWTDAAAKQEAARSVSDIETLYADWFAPNPMAGPVTYVVAGDLVFLEGVASLRNAGKTRGGILRAAGFKQELAPVDGVRRAVWVRGDCRPADLARIGTRYVPVNLNGRASVQIKAAAGS